MSTIYTRATKGSALTWTEGDANITNLNNDKIEDIVEDTTPQLGGDLDVNGHSIVSASNGNINIIPNGSGNINITPTTGKIVLGANDWPAGPGSTGQVLTTSGGTGVLSWETPSSGGIGNVVEDLSPQLGGDLDVNGKNITSASNGNINITPNGSGNISLSPASGHVTISATNFPTGAGTNGQFLQTDGTGNASWATVSAGGISNLVEDLSPQLGGALDVNGQQITSASNGNIAIVPNGSGNIQLTPSTGKITLGAVDWPTTGGTNGQVLTTNGTGTASWTTVSGGASALDDLSDVVITAAATNDVLVYNGTNWVDTAASTLSVNFASSATTASTATTATNATNINISTITGNTNDTTLYPVMVGNAATGSQLPHIDSSGLSFNASTNSLTLGTNNGTTAASIQLWSNAADSMTIKAADSMSASYTLTLPADDGIAGGLLQTNGSGTLSWSNAINSTSIGATTRSTGAFTTLTADTTTLDDIRETVAALTYAATITPNAADGSIRTITLTGNVTFSAFTTPVSGQTITLIITQDATGSRTLTSTMKFAGGLKTLSTAANSIDILTVSYIGTTYYASLAKGFA
jgi:hypothetical protein